MTHSPATLPMLAITFPYVAALTSLQMTNATRFRYLKVITCPWATVAQIIPEAIFSKMNTGTGPIQNVLKLFAHPVTYTKMQHFATHGRQEVPVARGIQPPFLL
ncbi:MAG: hypothetical protein BRD50_00220 [Bacteroidetes bacterium SW_11_45_7]|nr:MAG: hypothetical protein BRD50_00220 [Bacteroidetes bacterium SW_11_45_7]